MATAAEAKSSILWKTEHYFSQMKKYWPKTGKHILAQFDQDTVIVYQAFSPKIAKYAVENKRFGGPHFSFERMSWIKTNFLWMMYRSGWASKPNQERVLAVRITKQGFETILANAYSAKLQKSRGVQDVQVRLQWDPDHSPTYEKLERRAIQLGLKGEMLEKYATEWTVNITDVTDFCKKQQKIFQKEGVDSDNFFTASERVYKLEDSGIADQIEVDVESSPATVVSTGAAGP